MTETNWFDKLFASIINVAFVVTFLVPLNYLLNINWKILLIGIFFLYNLYFLIFNKNRCLGMVLLGFRWKRDYKLYNHLIFIVLYTLSFSTLLFHIFFPFDIFLINMFLFQLPMVLKHKTTLHGYLSGKMVGMKYINTPNK
jgi:hypothetical protein